MGAVYARVARRHGWRGSASGLDRRFHAVLARRGGAGSKASWQRFVREVFSGRVLRTDSRVTSRGLSSVGAGLAPAQFSSFFNDLFDTFSGPDVWQVFPDVRPTLARLRRRGIRLGVVSNWDARLFQTLKGLRLSRWFDFVLASGVIGVRKPHRGIFREALRRAGVSAGEAMHVGDSLEEDARGPHRAGMVGVWLWRGSEARRGRPSGRPVVDVPVIRSLTELLR